MGNHRTLIALCCVRAVAWSAQAGGNAYDPAEVLREVSRKVAARSARIPRYTCTETVERTFFRPLGWSDLEKPCELVLRQRAAPSPAQVLRPWMTDRLRLDVTVAGPNELYSWAGASRFEEAGIEKLVGAGPFGGGGFSAYLDIVFLGDVKQFRYEGRRSSPRGEVMEYSFEVPRENSHYSVKVNGAWVPAGYRGIIELDPRADEIVRMTMDTTEMPAAAGCQTQHTAGFSTVSIGRSPLLLATTVQQRFISGTADEVENISRFTQCREYRAESTIAFGVSEAPESPTATPIAANIPAGLKFAMELLAPIDTDQAAAGDPFQARLVEPLKDKQGDTLLPRGSIVEGRLLRVQTFHRSPAETVVVLEPRTVSNRGVTTPIGANRDWTRIGKQASERPKQALKMVLPIPEEAPAGVFDFPGKHIVIKKGFRSDWWTAKARSK